MTDSLLESNRVPVAQEVNMTPSSLPAALPHWVLEILGIGIGLAIAIPSWFGAAEPAVLTGGGYALLGAGVSGLLHDITG